MWIDVLEFIVILIVSVLLVVIVMLQDYYIAEIKKNYSEMIIGIIIFFIRTGLSASLVFFVEPTLIIILQATAIQSIISLSLWLLSKYVQKYKGHWLITIIAFITYGIATCFYIKLVFIDSL